MKCNSAVTKYINDVIGEKFHVKDAALYVETKALKKKIDAELAKICPKFDKECEAILAEATKKLNEAAKKHGLELRMPQADSIRAGLSEIVNGFVPTKFAEAWRDIADRRDKLCTAFSRKIHEIEAKIALGADAEKLEELLAKVAF